MPIVLPPFEVAGGVKPSGVKAEWGTCLLYLETIGFTMYQQRDTRWTNVGAIVEIGSVNGTNKFNWDETYVRCFEYGKKTADGSKFEPQNFTFIVEVKTDKSIEGPKNKDGGSLTLDGLFSFTLKFETVPGYGWRLSDVTAKEFTVKGQGSDLKSGNVKEGTSAINANVTNIGAYANYTYGCSATKALIFETTDKDVNIGVYFSNLQVQAYGYVVDGDKVHFSHNTADCVGTFTAASFMGIIVSLVLASVLVFGFLMLNSVQTVDRFDDPKQKQIVINSKD